MDRTLLQHVYQHLSSVLPVSLPIQDSCGKSRNEENPQVADSDHGSAADAVDETDFDKVLALAEKQHLMETVDSSIVKFSHDRIRQLSYELIGDDHVRSQVHYALGKFLFELDGQSLDSPHLLLITDQLNRGSAVLDQGKECRHFVMTLNLQASKVARRRFAESLVHRFLTKAVHLVVEKTDWDTCYELVVELYIALAAVESSRHAVEHSNALTEQVLEHARRPRDVASALAIQAKTLSFQMRDRGAIVKARQAMAALGVHLPRSRWFQLRVESRRIHRMVQDKSDHHLLNLPHMTDMNIRKVMQILVSTAMYSFAAEDVICSGLAICKMMELT